MKNYLVGALALIALSVGAAPAAQANPCDDAVNWQIAHNHHAVDTHNKAAVDAYNVEADRIDALLALDCGRTRSR